MSKRIMSAFLCLVLITGSVFSDRNTMKVQAAAAPAIDAQTAAEFAMLLYSILETGMIAAGAKEGLDEYETSQDLADAFDAFLVSMGLAPDTSWATDIEFTLEDGSTVTFNEETYELVLEDGSIVTVTHDQFLDACLTGTLVLDPETETQQDLVDDYIEAKSGFFSDWLQAIVDYHNGGSGGGDNGDGGDDQDLNNFSKVTGVTVGAGVVLAVADFIDSLLAGETELNPAVYYTGDEYMYNGTVPKDANGYYMYRGLYGPIDSYYNYYAFAKKDSPATFCAYADGNCISYGYYSSNSIYVCYWAKGRTIDNLTSTSNTGYACYPGCVYSFNFPFFESKDAALLYLQTGDASAALNAPVYGYQDLADSVPDTLAPLTGVKFSPNEMPGINNTLLTTAQAIPEPEAGTDTATNTETYKQTMTETLQEVAPEALPETDTGTGTDTETGTGTGTDTGTDTDNGSDTETGGEMDAEGYKVDLTMIFPFCLPFDLIYLLQALSAEPVTPVFEFPVVIAPLGIEEYVIIDLSFMDEVMEIFRLGELGLFIITLIVGTRKMIRW